MICPAPWCGRELGQGEEHPDHKRMVEDPDFEFYAIKNEAGELDVHKVPRRLRDGDPGQEG
jgi:hypothetical protein